MIITLITFSVFFFIKSILLTYFYNFNSIYLFPLEISSLVLSSSNILWSNYLTWILLGWIGLPKEMSYLQDIDDYEWLYILISWIICLFLYQIYYLVINRKNINKWTYYIHNLKFVIVNYFPLYMWSLNRLLNNTNTFIYAFINLIIFNLVTFCLPSLITYLIYGNKIITYRKMFPFLIKIYKKKYKWYILYEFFIKIIAGTFISFFYYWNVGNNYSLILINIIYIILNYYLKPFDKIIDNKSNIIFGTISLLIISISEIEIFYENKILFLIIKTLLIIIYLFLIILYIFKKKSISIKTKKYPNNTNNTNNTNIELIVNTN
jgi:hypothetical protein